jgi:membrane protein insertase Oxa1/YidC/SpoIIIJ
MFPLVIKMQQYSVRMHNIQPQVQHLQEQLSDARRMGDTLQSNYFCVYVFKCNIN